MCSLLHDMCRLALFLLALSHSDTGVVILKDGDGGPLQAEVGGDLSLLCNYQVMGDSLYSIKWYRDDKEFFRYIPRDSPPFTIFLLSGISVDDRSSPTHIILKNISLSTSGSYKCEVSGGPPRFQTDETVTELQVVDLPHSGPKIYGVSSKYFLGSRLLADCMLPQSHPPAILTWYVNSDTADSAHTSRQYSVTRNIDPHLPGNESSAHHTMGKFVAVSLNFTVKEKHVRQAEGVQGVLSLKCTAEVLDLYWRTSEVSVTVARTPELWFSPALSSSSTFNSSLLPSLTSALILTYSQL